MDDKPLGTLGVSQGRNPHSQAGSVGGGGSYIDDEGRAVVILGVGENDDPAGRELELHEGERFELGPELWEVTSISGAGSPRWSARLTRLR